MLYGLLAGLEYQLKRAITDSLDLLHSRSLILRPSVSPFIRPSVRHFVRPSLRACVCPSVHLSVRRSVRSSVLSHPSVRSSASVHQSIHRSFGSVCWSVSLSAHIRLSVCLSIRRHPSVCLFVRPSIGQSLPSVFVRLSVRASDRPDDLFFRPSACSTVIPSVSPVVCLFDCPSAHRSASLIVQSILRPVHTSSPTFIPSSISFICSSVLFVRLSV